MRSVKKIEKYISRLVPSMGRRLNLSLFLCRAQKPYLVSYSIYKHDGIDLADPSSMQNACYMNFITSLIVESLWLSSRASERGIWRSEVRFLMGTQNFLFVSRSWHDEKQYTLLNKKLSNSLKVLTVHIFF